MKSIMEEASSIFKAIENAWTRAGQPHDFSVKIFEEPQRNFFGMTVKSAKIGLFFDEKSVAKPAAAKTTTSVAPKQKPEHPSATAKASDFVKTSSDKKVDRPEAKKAAQPQKHTKPTPAAKSAESVKPSFVKNSQDRPTAKPERPAHQEKNAESGESIWTPDMVHAAEEWMRTTLSLMNMPHIKFSTKLSKYYIHFNFDAKLFENSGKEKTVFRSFAYLIMATLRNKLKKEFRGLKVVLSS